jgi:hypothetical protein
MASSVESKVKSRMTLAIAELSVSKRPFDDFVKELARLAAEEAKAAFLEGVEAGRQTGASAVLEEHDLQVTSDLVEEHGLCDRNCDYYNPCSKSGNTCSNRFFCPLKNIWRCVF